MRSEHTSPSAILERGKQHMGETGESCLAFDIPLLHIGRAKTMTDGRLEWHEHKPLADSPYVLDLDGAEPYTAP